MPEDFLTHPWNTEVEPFRIVGNLYYIGINNVSVHLIDTGEGLILLDTAYPQTLYLVLESIRRLGFDTADIRYLIHSHAHYDHCGGTRALVELTGAKTAMGKEDMEILHERPELTWASFHYGFEFYEAFEVDLPLDDGQKIVLGNTSIECVHTPGHTAGCMSFFFEVKDNGQTYKVGTHGGPGLNGLSREFLNKYGLPLSRQSDYLRSLQKLQERTVDIFIGLHPAQSSTLEKRLKMKEEYNPFIDQEAWPDFLSQLENRAKKEFGIA